MSAGGETPASAAGKGDRGCTRTLAPELGRRHATLHAAAPGIAERAPDGRHVRLIAGPELVSLERGIARTDRYIAQHPKCELQREPTMTRRLEQEVHQIAGRACHGRQMSRSQGG